MLTLKEVQAVYESIGAYNIDLHVEVIIKDNHELLNLIEGVKAIDGVKEVHWSETIRLIGSNSEAMLLRAFADK